MAGRTALTASFAVLLGLAGCVGASDTAQHDSADVAGLVEPPPVAATSTTGGLRCIAVDAAVRPLADVMVTVVPGNRGALTDGDGWCVIDGLEPGIYLVQAHKAGHESAFTSATVSAGDDEPEPIRLVLPHIGGEGAFAVTQVHELTLAAAVVAGGTRWAEAPGTGDEVDHDLHRSATWPAVEHVQSELVWEPQSAFAEALFIHCWITPEQGASNRTEGTSMVPNVVRPLAFGEDDEYHCYIGPVGTGPAGLAFYADQDITVYATIFYGFLPEPNWFFTLDGEHPPP